MLLDSEATMINILETTAYFQGKRTVNDYLNQFCDLIYDSGYTDPITVVVKFQRGLDCRISMALLAWHPEDHQIPSQKPGTTSQSRWTRTEQRMRPSKPSINSPLLPTIRIRQFCPDPHPHPRLQHILPIPTLLQVTQSQWTLMQPTRLRPFLTPANTVEKLVIG